ncbi:MAG: homoserine kinase [Burkholderiales bacterium]|nr:homoserine kinase [Burkholderiales bacterium]
MAVFTPVSQDELAPWLAGYDLGAAVRLEGIASGIENSNFFLTTTRGTYVLTIFEKLTADELPFYLDLTAHLADGGIPCPAPLADRAGRHFSLLKDKPAAIVRRLPGRSHMAPTGAERAAVGAMLARMHLAGAGFAACQDNPRGPHWWSVTAPRVRPYLDTGRAAMLDSELSYQATHRHDRLPRGPIHADLFRDNVLFDGPRIGGFIDFYFAGCDCLLFDVAVCVNDWCIARDGPLAGTLVDDEVGEFLAAYHAVRPFTDAERLAWDTMLRAGALRFWLSRLFDFHLPRPGELVHPHDPSHFERILRLRRDRPAPWLG